MLIKGHPLTAALQTAPEAGTDLPSEDPRAVPLRASAYAQAQDYDRAEAAYIATLRRAPDLAIARFQLGLLQFTSARPSVASTTRQRLDQLEDRHPLKLFKLAFECLARDQFEGAVHGLQAGIAANTENLPLNRDMQMVIDRIRELGLEISSKPADTAAIQTTDEASIASKDGEDTAIDRESQAHFLVSTYRNLN